MPKHKFKTIVSKRQMYRRIASEVKQIQNEVEVCQILSM